MDKLVTKITKHLEEVARGHCEFSDISCDDAAAATGQNQFLFFIKPELTSTCASPHFKDVLEIIFDGISRFGLAVEGVRVLSGTYLKKHGIMAQHYGVINKLAREAKKNLSIEAQQAFQEQFGRSVEEVDVLGGLEFLDAHPEVTCDALEASWEEAGNKKLAGGTYCAELQHGGESAYIINGFHPQQLALYTQPEKIIVTLNLRGDTPWKEARQDFVGATNAATANPGSLRGILFARQGDLGLAEVSQRFNGIHLSAGPVEGLAELVRFAPRDGEGRKDAVVTDFVFGRKLAESFDMADVHYLLGNPDVEYEGRNLSVFDLTEELDSGDALERLRIVLANRGPAEN